MNHDRIIRCLGTALVVTLVLPVVLTVAVFAQIPHEIANNLPVVIPDPEPKFDQSLEFGASLGRYDFDNSSENSAYDAQFIRYARSRPAVDSWLVDAGRQHRFDQSSLDLGLGYTRYLGKTGLSAGISGGTNKVLSHEYRIGLGVSHPLAGFITRLDYTKSQSHGENRSDSWGLGVTRWFSHWILGGGYRFDIGQPGSTESASYNFGITYYQWRRTYLGAGVQTGDVSYQLLGPGVPLSSQVLIDYSAWSAHLSLMHFISDKSGFNLRYDHSRAQDNWIIDGFTCSYFREW